MPKYVIKSAVNVLTVLEALEGTNFEPVTLTRIAQRTGFNNNICTWALGTLEAKGYAKQLPDKRWMMTTKLLRLAGRLEAAALSD